MEESRWGKVGEAIYNIALPVPLITDNFHAPVDLCPWMPNLQTISVIWGKTPSPRISCMSKNETMEGEVQPRWEVQAMVGWSGINNLVDELMLEIVRPLRNGLMRIPREFYY